MCFRAACHRTCCCPHCNTVPVSHGDENDQKSIARKSRTSEGNSCETSHELTVDGKSFSYKATAGKLLMKSDKLEERAEIFFIAYTRPDVDVAKRPITFCFNGGPWLVIRVAALGMLGPS